MKRIKKVLGLIILLFALFVLFKVLQSIFFDPITTTFNVTVQTELIEYKTLNKNRSRLVLYDALIEDDNGIVSDNFNGSIDLEVGVYVTIERVAYGPILIRIENEDGGSIGKLYRENEDNPSHKGEDYLIVSISNIEEKVAAGQTFIFNISGDIETGRSINFEMYDQSTALLRGGQVKMIGSSRWSKNLFEAGTRELNLGDQLVFDDPETEAFGFAMVNENAGMNAAYRVDSKEASVIKPGPQNQGSGYKISASLLDKFLKDRFYQAISILFATLIAILTILTFIIDVVQFYDELKNEK